MFTIGVAISNDPAPPGCKVPVASVVCTVTVICPSTTSGPNVPSPGFDGPCSGGPPCSS